MNIHIRKFGDASVCIELPMLSPIPLVRLWKERILTDLLLLAFSNRAATLVTIDPTTEAIGYRFPGQLLISGGHSYLVNNMDAWQYHDLVQIGECPEITRGLLTLVAGKNNYQFDNYFPKTEVALLTIKNEMFICSPDAHRVYWLNTNREYSDLLLAINDIADFYQLLTAS
jgi:hypothetical protein